MLRCIIFRYGVALLFVAVMSQAVTAQEREQYGRVKKEVPIYLLLNNKGELVLSHAEDKTEGKMMVTVEGDKEGNSLLRVTHQEKTKYLAFPSEKPKVGEPIIRLVEVAEANCKWKRTELFPQQSDSKQPIYSEIFYAPSQGEFKHSYLANNAQRILVFGASIVAERIAYDNLYDGK